MHSRTIAISINASWNIINFRRGLIKAFQQAGYRVVALAPVDRYSEQFASLGVEFLPIEIDKQGISPGKDLLLLWRYYRSLRRLRPDIFLGYTAKPNVYGSIAAHLLGIPVINNVAGLGTAFIKQGLLTSVVKLLYAIAFRRSRTVFFQNRQDLDEFVAGGIVSPAEARLLPGSGIDLVGFSPSPKAISEPDRPIFLLIARLLWDKGVREFVEAARLVRAQLSGARFQLLGFLDVENRTAVGRKDVEQWAAEGVIEYLGEADDVRPFIAAADCIVLPSYREGLPRVLLEGAAMAKPLIATDVPGCRHVVEEGRNGFLCAPRDSASLAAAMIRMARLPVEARLALGGAGRRLIESEFDERIVFDRYLEAVSEALGTGGLSSS